MALRTVPIVVLMPLMIGMKNATILFHTSVKNVLMAVHTVVQTALIPSRMFDRNALMPSHVVVKNDLIASHAPCQSPLRRLRNTTMTVRIAFTAVEM